MELTSHYFSFDSAVITLLVGDTDPTLFVQAYKLVTQTPLFLFKQELKQTHSEKLPLCAIQHSYGVKIEFFT